MLEDESGLTGRDIDNIDPRSRVTLLRREKLLSIGRETLGGATLTADFSLRTTLRGYGVGV